uniref:RNA2 polyprotein n=1 Tax=Bean rugose mosaic virus TaxID=128790 RepID=A0A1S6XZI2_9SECO|nr:polyprotein [Bean rugose mosaic virus]
MSIPEDKYRTYWFSDNYVKYVPTAWQTDTGHTWARICELRVERFRNAFDSRFDFGQKEWRTRRDISDTIFLHTTQRENFLLWIVLFLLYEFLSRFFHIFPDTPFLSKFLIFLSKKLIDQGSYRRYKNMQTVLERGIPAQVLQEKAAQFKQARANDKLTDVIPKANQMYQRERTGRFNFLNHLHKNAFTDLAKLAEGDLLEQRHMPVGALTPGENCVLDIPLVRNIAEMANSSAEVFDDYVDTKKNKKGSTEMTNTVKALHVGAIEIIIESFASPDSDIQGALLLVDTAHERPENAIRSIFVSSFSGGKPIRVVLFPDTLVQYSPHIINDRFKLVCTTSNSDFVPGIDLAMVKVNVVAAAVGLKHRYTPTPYHSRELKKERGFIVEYIGKQAYLAHNVNNPTLESLLEQNFQFNFQKQPKLKRLSSTSAVFERGGYFTYNIGSSAGKQVAQTQRSLLEPDKKEKPDSGGTITGGLSSKVDGKHGNVFAQSGDGLFSQKLDDPGPIVGSYLDRKIGQTKVIIPKTLTGGTVLLDSLLSELIIQPLFRGTLEVQRSHRQVGKIKCLIMLGIPENSGLALMCAINSSIRGAASADVYTISSQDSILWNPACSNSVVFEFNPNPAGDSWSLNFLRGTLVHFTLLCVTGWTTTPSTDAQVTLDWFVSPELCKPRIYRVLEPEGDILLNRWMGKLIFPQGNANVIRKMPLSIGGGAGAKNSIIMNMPNAVLSLWRYFKGDLTFELTKMSSPYIKSTISFLISFAALPDDTLNFEAYPHKLVRFQEIQAKTTLTSSQEEFLTAWSTQVRPDTKNADDGCPYLYAILHDSTVSTINGDFVLGVVLKEVTNLQPYGFNPGIQGSRLLGSVQAQSDLQYQQIRNPIFKLRTPADFDPKKQNFCNFAVDLLGLGVTTDTTGQWRTEVVNSPLANLLRTSAWKRGKLYVRVVMTGASVSRSEWNSYTILNLTNSMNVQHYPAQTWRMGNPHTWSLDFEIDLVGPNNGFEMWQSNWANQTSWHLECAVVNPLQTTTFEILYGIDSTFSVAGNVLMPAFVIPDASATIGDLDPVDRIQRLHLLKQPVSCFDRKGKSVAESTMADVVAMDRMYQ